MPRSEFAGVTSAAALVVSLITVAGGVLGIDPTVDRQFVSVAISSEVVPPPTGTSPFFGVGYFTLDNAPDNATMVGFEWLVFHTLTQATSVTLRGPANETSTGPLVVDLAQGGQDPAGPKLFGRQLISKTAVEQLLLGTYYLQISSGGIPQGEARGHIDRGGTRYVAVFGGNTLLNNTIGMNTTLNETVPRAENATGLAIVRIFDAGFPTDIPESLVGINYWIIAEETDPLVIYLGRDSRLGDTQGHVTFTFGPPSRILPGVVSLFFCPIFSDEWQFVEVQHIRVAEPALGPGSSSMSLTTLGALGIPFIKATFFRIL